MTDSGRSVSRSVDGVFSNSYRFMTASRCPSTDAGHKTINDEGCQARPLDSETKSRAKSPSPSPQLLSRMWRYTMTTAKIGLLDQPSGRHVPNGACTPSTRLSQVPALRQVLYATVKPDGLGSRALTGIKMCQSVIIVIGGDP